MGLRGKLLFDGYITCDNCKEKVYTELEPVSMHLGTFEHVNFTVTSLLGFDSRFQNWEIIESTNRRDLITYCPKCTK